MFDITVFGDEPYGNYNRILLSQRSGRQSTDPAEIYLNAMDWYADNRIDLRAGVRVVRIDTLRARWCTPTTARRLRYDKLILATGSRSFFPPMAGLWADNKTLTDGVFGFRTLDDTCDDDRRGRAPHQGRGHRRRAARPGSRTRACRTGACTSTSCTPGTTLMNAQLDDRPAPSCAGRWKPRNRRAHSRSAPPRSHRRRTAG